MCCKKNESERSTQVAKVMRALENNRMTASYVASREEVVPMIEKLLQPGDVIGLGGSVTLQECGVLELVRRPEYRLIDRYAPGLSREQTMNLHRDALAADVYLSGCNAITENGELYNVDGNANRVAALLFGPKRVIVVASVQKIVPDIAAAVERVRTIAAPRNAQRLKCDTYCAVNGHCVACGQPMGAGCNSTGRICRDFAVCGAQGVQGRIHVILVGEPLGF